MRACFYCGAPASRKMILECQQCKKHFCPACFESKISPQAFPEMYRRHIMCPDCYLQKYGKGRKGTR